MLSKSWKALENQFTFSIAASLARIFTRTYFPHKYFSGILEQLYIDIDRNIILIGCVCLCVCVCVCVYVCVCVCVFTG